MPGMDTEDVPTKVIPLPARAVGPFNTVPPSVVSISPHILSRHCQMLGSAFKALVWWQGWWRMRWQVLRLCKGPDTVADS